MFKNVKWSSLIISVIYLVAGILMFMYPGRVPDFVCYVIGIGAIVYGVIQLAGYFMMDLKKSLFSNDFAFGIIMILLGGMVIYHQKIIMELIPFLCAVLLIGSGFIKLQDGIDASRIGTGRSWLYVICSIISLVFGLVVLFDLLPKLGFSDNPQDLYRFIGAGLVYSGVMDLIFAMYLSGRIRKWVKEQESKEVLSEKPAKPEITDEVETGHSAFKPIDADLDAVMQDEQEKQPEAADESLPKEQSNESVSASDEVKTDSEVTTENTETIPDQK